MYVCTCTSMHCLARPHPYTRTCSHIIINSLIMLICKRNVKHSHTNTNTHIHIHKSTDTQYTYMRAPHSNTRTHTHTHTHTKRTNAHKITHIHFHTHFDMMTLCGNCVCVCLCSISSIYVPRLSPTLCLLRIMPVRSFLRRLFSEQMKRKIHR